MELYFLPTYASVDNLRFVTFCTVERVAARVWIFRKFVAVSPNTRHLNQGVSRATRHFGALGRKPPNRRHSFSYICTHCCFKKKRVRACVNDMKLSDVVTFSYLLLVPSVGP